MKGCVIKNIRNNQMMKLGIRTGKQKSSLTQNFHPKRPTHEQVKLPEYQPDWVKIVDFFINGPFLGKGTFLFTSLYFSNKNGKNDNFLG